MKLKHLAQVHQISTELKFELRYYMEVYSFFYFALFIRKRKETVWAERAAK
jgi:hypothetical protein